VRIIPQFAKLRIISPGNVASALGVSRDRIYLEFDYTPGTETTPSLGRFHVLVDGLELKPDHRQRLVSYLLSQLDIMPIGDA